MQSNDFTDILRVGLILGGAFVFVVMLVAWIVWWNKRAARGAAVALEEARADALLGRARIVELRRAEVQRSREFTLFKVLFEVFPADSSAAFSSVAVLEVEAPALGAMQPGTVLPVKIDPQNRRRVFPDIPGARYSQTYQFAFLGIENDIEPERFTAAAQIAPEAPKPNTVYRKRSKTRIFGLPLWEIAFNLINKSGRVRHVRSARARAVIAIGDSATGVIAVGSFARGIVAVGQFGLGLLTLGSGGLGIISIGIMPFGLLAFGAISGGALSFGALAAGFVAVGFLTISPYAFSLDGRSAPLLPVYDLLKNAAGLNDAGMRMIVEYGLTITVILCFAFFFLWMISSAILVKILEPNDNRLDSPR